MSSPVFASLQSKLRLTFVFLLISATLGVSLRLMQSGTLGGNFKYILHTHSHIVLLGWLYNSIVIIIQYFIFKKQEGPLNWVFWLSQITYFGMMFSFPFQGYAFASILFSTLYLFSSYALVYYLFKYAQKLENQNVVKLIKWSGVYLVLSSFGPFSLGFIMAKGLQDTFWFKLSVYWFIHFLYNGFFTLIVFALLLNKSNSFPAQKWGSQLMIWSIIPIYGLSVLWLEPHSTLYIITFIGTLFQLFAFVLIGKHIQVKQLFHSKWARCILKIAIAAYGLKVIFQISSVLPAVQVFLQSTTPYSVIGFIHLVMLGFFTLFVLAIFLERKWVLVSLYFKVGVTLLIIGVILSEAMLFSQGILLFFFNSSLPNFFFYLALVSFLMPVGICLITIGLFTQKKKVSNN
ncbi:MAG: hypothetical protein ACPGVC_03870 [Salibacteraceae bacterium]